MGCKAQSVPPRIGVKTVAGILALLLLFSLTALVADAQTTVRVYEEDNGYWTETVDESGQVLSVFTYTQPVVWQMAENEGYGSCRMSFPASVNDAGQPASASVSAFPGFTARMLQALSAVFPGAPLPWIQRLTLVLWLAAGLVLSMAGRHGLTFWLQSRQNKHYRPL